MINIITISYYPIWSTFYLNTYLYININTSVITEAHLQYHYSPQGVSFLYNDCVKDFIQSLICTVGITVLETWLLIRAFEG